jgi:hypothetical protein
MPIQHCGSLLYRVMIPDPNPIRNMCSLFSRSTTFWKAPLCDGFNLKAKIFFISSVSLKYYSKRVHNTHESTEHRLIVQVYCRITCYYVYKGDQLKIHIGQWMHSRYWRGYWTLKQVNHSLTCIIIMSIFFTSDLETQPWSAKNHSLMHNNVLKYYSN